MIPDASAPDPATRRGRLVRLLAIASALGLAALLVVRCMQPVHEVAVTVTGIPAGIRPVDFVAESPDGRVVARLRPTERSTTPEDAGWFYGGPQFIDPFQFQRDPLRVYVAWRDLRRIGLLGTDASGAHVVRWFRPEDSRFRRWPRILSTPECALEIGSASGFEKLSPELEAQLCPPAEDRSRATPEQQQAWLRGDLSEVRKYARAQNAREAKRALTYLEQACDWVVRRNSAITSSRRDVLADKSRFSRIAVALDSAAWADVLRELDELDACLAHLLGK